MQNETTLKTTDFDAIRLRLASPDVMRTWSYGEVTKPETINYRTQKPEKAGLFAEEIFGPVKDWECYCGKYKKIRYKGIVCDKCGVEVTKSIVRRERMGHIELAAPVSHIWFLRGVPSKIGTVLDLSVQSLEKVIYFANFIVTEVHEEAKAAAYAELKEEYKNRKKMIEGEWKRDTERAKGKGLSDADLTKAIETLDAERERRFAELDDDFEIAERDLKGLEPLAILTEETYQELSLKYGHIFEASIGAEAVYELLTRIDLEKLAQELQEGLQGATAAKYERIVRRLKLVSSLVQNGIRPEWMVLTVLPVLPPDLRPMVALDGGRFATSDLNDLYRRVINRNNRMKRLKELNAPEVIVRNEKRMLQEAVDALIDNNARHSKTVLAATGKKRQLKSLADALKGKQGRFRQNLLGKRTDYSGRSVIVVGPHLHLDECGVPKRMALELFKPFVISKLISRGYVHNIRSANRYIEADHAEVWDILEEITSTSYVLLNRAPTLHRLGIQAFRPILIEGKALQIHPMVCKAYNADFDGDQMAVHVPITEEARWEAANLMLSTKNLLRPADGRPIVAPDKDVVLGIYYMTMLEAQKEGVKPRAFANPEEAKTAFQLGLIRARERALVRVKPGEPLVETSVGRILVNELFPEKIGFVNDTFTTKKLNDVVKSVLDNYGMAQAAAFLDKIKEFGFKQLTFSGISWGIGDLPKMEEKTALIEEGNRRSDEIMDQYNEGLLTAAERHTGIVKVWSEIKERVVELVKKNTDKQGPVMMMMDSGARGSITQLTQMVGMKGAVQNPQGDVIELPVKHSFREGMSVIEFFISTHGTRKGLSDTALRTANAGYLTRRLVDVAQDVVISMEDCGDESGVVVTQKECVEIGEPMLTRILGRVSVAAIKDGNEVIVNPGEYITEAHVKRLAKVEIPEANIRSVMTCRLQKGVCAKCYGYDLAYNEPAKLGTAVGIIAAQSIGEPGTQLTMRTFHQGGVAGKDITQGLPRVEELFEARTPKRRAFMSDVSGTVMGIELIEHQTLEGPDGKPIFSGTPGQKLVKIAYKGVEEEFVALSEDDEVKIKDGAKVKKGMILAKLASGEEVIAEHAGDAKVSVDGVGVVFEGEGVKEYIIPPGYSIQVKQGDSVNAGDPLTEGHLDLQQLFRHKGKEAVMLYLSREIQHVYASEGARLNNKHIEIIIRQMFSRIYVKSAGDTDLLPGEIVEKHRFVKANEASEEKASELATGDELFLGITKVSLTTESFLSAASFMETMKVLVNAAVTGKVDPLAGLKENVIIGRLIPVGTGFGEDESKAGSAEASAVEAAPVEQSVPEQA